MTDIIDLIDKVTAPPCGQCGTSLRPDGPSAEFCGEDCQERWYGRRSMTTPMDQIWARFCTAYYGPAVNMSAQRDQTPGWPIEIVDRCEDSTTVAAQGPAPAGGPACPATAVLIGGHRHGTTIGIPDPPRHTLEVPEEITPSRILFDSDLIRVQRVSYQLVGHNGMHWCYVDPRPVAPTRTIHSDRTGALTVRYHHQDLRRLTCWVTITGSRGGVVCELPMELLVDDAAVSAWFAEQGQRPTGALSTGPPTLTV